MDILIKVGSKYPDINDPRHFTQWRDGQIIDIREDGFYGMDSMSRKHHCVIRLPHIDFWEARGTRDLKATGTKVFEIKSLLDTPEKNGKFRWELPEDYERTEDPDFKRRYFIDLQWLLDNGYINTPQFESAYDKSRMQVPIVIPTVGLYDILRIEGTHERLNSEKDQSPGSINSGTYTIGAAGNYATLTAFEADIEATLTGNLTAEHLNEESSISGSLTFSLDANNNSINITAQSGAEHNGSAYGNGARINYIGYSPIIFSAIVNCTKIEVSKLAINVQGNCDGLYITNCAGGNHLINRCLLQGNNTDNSGIKINYNGGNVEIRNNIIYDFLDTGAPGILFWNYTYTHKILNNTIASCTIGIKQDDSTVRGTKIVKNNICQNNGTDFVDDGGGFGTTGYNVSEDNTSPDTSYRNINLHDGNSCFIDYDNDDYRLNENGDEISTLTEGEDLSGTFTDDIVGTTRSTWYIGAYELGLTSSSSSSSSQSLSSSSSSESVSQSSSNSSSSESVSVSFSSSSSSESQSSSQSVSSSSVSVSSSLSSSSESTSNSSSSSSMSIGAITEHQFTMKTIDRTITMKTVSRNLTMKTINRDFTMTDK